MSGLRNWTRWQLCRAANFVTLCDLTPRAIWYRLLPWVGEYAYAESYESFCRNADFGRRLKRDPEFRAEHEAARNGPESEMSQFFDRHFGTEPHP